MPRIGLAFRGAVPLEEIVAGAKHAEDRGYESIWTVEGYARDAFSLLTSVAHSTKRIGLGTGVTNIYTRSPLLIAVGAATVDEASQGRMILGLGTSHKSTIEGSHSIPFVKPLQRMRETVEIVRHMIQNQAASYEGEIFKVSHFKMRFKPIRQKIPIYLAALGPRMAQLAGEIGDGVLLIHTSPQHAKETKALVEEGTRKAGRNPSDIDIASYLVCCVSKDGAQARKIARRGLADSGRLPLYHKLYSSMGFPREASLLREAWSKGSIDEAAECVSMAMVNALTVSGTPEECRRKLEEYRSAGISLPVIYPDSTFSKGGLKWITDAVDTFVP